MQTPLALTSLEQVLRQHEIEQLLYHEAALLDGRHYREWLDLLTDDMRYWVPVRSVRALGEDDREFAGPYDQAYFDDDKAMLTKRVAKLETGFAWSENPPSRTRHLVSNVQLRDGGQGDEITVDCCFVTYRGRPGPGDEETVWFGRREDVLRRDGGRWKIARRTIYLDQSVLKASNLSVFI